VTTISFQFGPVASVNADALVIGVYKDGDTVVLAPGAEPVDAAFGGSLLAGLKALGATGAADEVTRIPSAGSLAAPLIVALGLGPNGAGEGEVVGVAGLEDLRKSVGAAVRSLAGLGRVAVVTSGAGPEIIEATALGGSLAAYSFTDFKTGDPAERKAPVAELILVAEGEGGAEPAAAAHRAQVIADAVKATRDLINTPPSHLYPESFADAVGKAVSSADAAAAGTLKIEILDDEELRAGGYGGLSGVGQGSSRGPRLVRVSYEPAGATRSLAFVGKGITFDTGGISLKPPNAMETMKSDMSGAAAVVHATIAVAELGLPVKVTAWAALAENMPGGNAIRPSDVLTMFGGKTVEVLNTDAEGRLVLADAIVRAGREQPDAIVDVATLTGAQVISLGLRTAAVMANDEEFRIQVESAAERAGEDVWPMPLPTHLRKSLDSEVADLKNIGDGAAGGMLTAGMFLKEFVAEGIAWAHLDMAGPAFNDGAPYGYAPKGGTGFAVRTLVQLAQDAADGLL